MYHLTKILDLPFEQAIDYVTEALKAEGMGVLTEIDVQAAFAKKLQKSFRPYRILGACHPAIAYSMLEIDDKAGVLYPCNVVVQEQAEGRVEVSAINPMTMFVPIQDPRAQAVAKEAFQTLSAVMQRLDQKTVTVLA